MLLLSLSVANAAPELPNEVEARVDKALDAVDATGEQRATVYRLVDEIVPQAKAFRDEARALREDIRALFTEPEIDREALEVLRVEAVGLFDRATAFAFDNLADLAEVFSVEQRQKLRELHEAHRREMLSKFHHWHDAG